MRPEIQRARELRNNMSEPEVMLWARLKRLRSHGYHFRRQAPIHGYFLDFVCFPRRLAIEVDGGQHDDARQADHDLVRDQILDRQGFTVLRFRTGDVRRNIGWVMDQVMTALEAEPQTSHAAPEPHFPTLAAARPVPPH